MRTRDIEDMDDRPDRVVFAADVTANERISGAPGETRTPDLLVRSQTLYPAELRRTSTYLLASAGQIFFRLLFLIF
jgi:hypothetical protein